MINIAEEYIIIHCEFLKLVFKIEFHLAFLFIVLIFSETLYGLLFSLVNEKLKIAGKVRYVIMLDSAYEKYRFLCILSYVCLNIMYGITGFFAVY